MTIQPQLRPNFGTTNEYTAIPIIVRIKMMFARQDTRLGSTKPLSFILFMLEVTRLIGQNESTPIH